MYQHFQANKIFKFRMLNQDSTNSWWDILSCCITPDFFLSSGKQSITMARRKLCWKWQNSGSSWWFFGKFSYLAWHQLQFTYGFTFMPLSWTFEILLTFIHWIYTQIIFMEQQLMQLPNILSGTCQHFSGCLQFRQVLYLIYKAYSFGKGQTAKTYLLDQNCLNNFKSNSDTS